MSLQLPYCGVCVRYHWPAREICPYCLGSEIVWRQAVAGGQVVAATVLHHSLAQEFHEHLPLHIATVRLDCDVRALVYLDGGAVAIGSRVRVLSGKGPTGQDALVARPVSG